MTIQVKVAFEEFLLAKMAQLCSGASDDRSEATRAIEELGLFDVVTPFARIADMLGPGIASPPRVVDGVPDSLKIATEHRYQLNHWPNFEFVILESAEGVAWGYWFVRRPGVNPAEIRSVADLGRWSHTASEVHAALGPPLARESWAPCDDEIYRDVDRDFALCFVFGLLQTVKPTRQRDSQ